MDKLQLFNPESNMTYVLELPEDVVKRARSDMLYAQKLLQNYQHELISSNEENNINKEDKDTNIQQKDAANNQERDTWTRNEALALIESYKTRMEEFYSVKKRKHVWDNISNDLLSINCNKSAKSCEVKWKNLVRTYKSVKDNSRKTGRGVSKFAFFEEMDEVLGDKPSASCSHTYESCVSTPSVGEKSNKEMEEENLNKTSDGKNNPSVNVDINENVTYNSPQPHCSKDSAQPNVAETTETSTPKRKRLSHYEDFIKLKKQVLLEKCEEREERKKYLEEETKKKEDRAERKLCLFERYLEIEERKVRALEKYLSLEKNS